MFVSSLTQLTRAAAHARRNSQQKSAVAGAINGASRRRQGAILTFANMSPQTGVNVRIGPLGKKKSASAVEYQKQRETREKRCGNRGPDRPSHELCLPLLRSLVGVGRFVFRRQPCSDQKHHGQQRGQNGKPHGKMMQHRSHRKSVRERAAAQCDLNTAALRANAIRMTVACARQDRTADSQTTDKKKPPRESNHDGIHASAPPTPLAQGVKRRFCSFK